MITPCCRLADASVSRHCKTGAFFWQRSTNELFTEFNCGHLIIHHRTSIIYALLFSDVNLLGPYDNSDLLFYLSTMFTVLFILQVSWMVINTDNLVMKLLMAY